MKPCFLIPCFEHGRPLRAVLESLAPFGLDCIVVDDGSGEATQADLKDAARALSFVRIERLPENRGKGAALSRGFERAAADAFSHVVTLDADGQHDAAAVPRFLAAMERDPTALVLGRPVFDASAPRSRIWARQLSRWSVWAATRSFAIGDPLCGMRGVPVALAQRVIRSAALGPRMEFDPEFAVRCQWMGAPIVNLEVRVVYPPEGLSHFRVGRDFAALTRTYARLIATLKRRRPT